MRGPLSPYRIRNHGSKGSVPLPLTPLCTSAATGSRAEPLRRHQVLALPLLFPLRGQGGASPFSSSPVLCSATFAAAFRSRHLSCLLPRSSGARKPPSPEGHAVASSFTPYATYGIFLRILNRLIILKLNIKKEYKKNSLWHVLDMKYAFTR